MEASTYVNSKHRYRADVGDEPIAVKLPGNATDADVLHAMHALNSNSDCTGFIVQLPLPEPIRQGVVLESIDPAKDADGLHPINLGSWCSESPAF